MKKAVKWCISLACLTSGGLILILHSSISDVGVVLLFAGTLFTLWHKMGQVEEKVGFFGTRLGRCEEHIENMKKDFLALARDVMTIDKAVSSLREEGKGEGK